MLQGKEQEVEQVDNLRWILVLLYDHKDPN